jgi:DNA segregation ATPase FtsK/SpoIIIE, S-DNA-T family
VIIPVGKTRFHKQMYFSFSPLPHMKIAGVTGSGKSAFMQYLMYYMCSHESSDKLSFIIIDLKGGATFSHFATLPHVLGLYADIDEAEAALGLAHEEMNKRLQVIRTRRAEFKIIPAFPRLVVITDEGGEMSPELAVDKEDAKQRKRIYKHLSSIARIGRESRVNLVYGTQQPNAQTLPTNIRGQLEATFCFRVENEIDSEIVLRHKGAERLPRIPGRCLYKSPMIGEVEIQTPYVAPDILERFITTYPLSTRFTNKQDSVSGGSSSKSIIDFTEFMES